MQQHLSADCRRRPSTQHLSVPICASVLERSSAQRVRQCQSASQCYPFDGCHSRAPTWPQLTTNFSRIVRIVVKVAN